MEAYAALLLSTFGGTVAGPVFVRVAGGDGTAGGVTGLLGGVAAHCGAAALGIGEVPRPVLGPVLGEVYGRPDIVRHAQDFPQGAGWRRRGGLVHRSGDQEGIDLLLRRFGDGVPVGAHADQERNQRQCSDQRSEHESGAGKIHRRAGGGVGGEGLRHQNGAEDQREGHD